MAAAYAFHVCGNHPFVDGNKRAAVAAMIAFLSDNGWSFTATADEAEPVILQLASGALDKPTFTEWVRSHVREKLRIELRDFFSRLSYQRVFAFIESAMLHEHPGLAQKERFDSMIEAARSISAILEATAGASAAEENGKLESAQNLRSQAILLTAIYRIAQGMGYEW